MAILTRENVIKSDRFEMVEVDVTEWGEMNPETNKPEKTTVFVRELTAREKDALDMSSVSIHGKKQKVNMDDFRAKLAVLVCCDQNRQPIFEKNDVEWLTKKSARPLCRIYDAANKLNNFTDEDDEELLKN